MSANNCKCNKYNCTEISLFASIILGIVGAMLFFNAVITITVPFYWAVLATAVIILLSTLYISTFVRSADITNCICRRLANLYIGIFGTILSSLILLSVTFAATSILGAIIVGVLIFFVAYMLTATACLATCIAKCNAE